MWLQVTLSKGADTKQIKNHSKYDEGRYIKSIKNKTNKHIHLYY